MTVPIVDRRPSLDRCPLPAGGFAIGLAAVSLLALADTGTRRQPVLLALGGIVAFAVGTELWRRRHRLLGLPIAIAGCGAVGVAFAAAAVTVPSISHRLILLPGIVGIGLLALAVCLPIAWHTRGLVIVGAGLVFAAVLVAGILDTAPLELIVLAGTGTVLAWDVADHGIGLGRQVGRDAPSWRGTVVHVLAAVIAAAVFVFATLLVYGTIRIGLSLTALVVLLFSCVLLVLALRH